MNTKDNAGAVSLDVDDDIELAALLAPLAQGWKILLCATVLAGAVGAASSYLVTPQFTAENVFLLPQQQQSSANAALASLGALSALGAGGMKTVPDEYIAMMQSATVSDRIIKKFGLKALWDERYDIRARKRLLKQVAFTAGKKDSLVHVEVSDTDPTRAAAMANQYVEELRSLTNVLTVTEAQGRRVFFENLLKQTRDRLSAAQSALEASGYGAGVLKAQPSGAAENYARLRAELTSAQVKLDVLRSGLADGAPEVQSQLQTVNSLTSQVAKLETEDKTPSTSGNYVNRFREFKYQETLFDLFARQYENARVDESREGVLIQVLDRAAPPELKSSPRRSLYALCGALAGLLLAGIVLVFRRGKPADGLS